MDALGINLAGLVTQIVSFLVLFAILYKLLYKPVLGMLDTRATRIKESIDTADKVREEAVRSQEDMQQQIAASRAESQAMIAQAKELGEKYREEELFKAKAEIAAARARAETDIQSERDAAIEELRREFAGLAISAAERVVERSLSKSDHRDLIDKVLDESPQITKRS